MIKINEIFGPTIQGEGKSVWREVIFVRTSLCNLHCVWCDTPYTWNWGASYANESGIISKEKEIKLMSSDEVVKEILDLDVKDKTFAVVLSGGEPLLQQKQLVPTLVQLKQLGYWIEVETNGTIMPIPSFLDTVNQFNCSPKLSNSSNDSKIRIKPEVLKALSSNHKTNFKFVISDEKDVHEILQLVETYQMNEVYLMPLGITETELEKSRALTKELARQFHFNYTDRIHISILGGGRKV